MFDSFGFFVVIGSIWVAIGVALSVVMGRRGHNGFGWLVTGTLLGPFALVLAIDARRHNERLRPVPLVGTVPATVGTGPVNVLVGSDGSPESAAAMDAAVELLGDRIGRLTVATVVPYGDVREPERLATQRLRELAGRTSGRTPDLEVLHGHPSAALRQCAAEGGYELIAVGTRGRGLTRALLGSAASELARDSKVPVLLVGPTT
jgi:nucleotide-binding universal stress UspA family protein